MASKPSTAAEYLSDHTRLVKATCLYIATILGDLMGDLLIVGGLVPSLIVDQDSPDPELERHVGTMDLDIGLQLSLLSERRYSGISERLRDAGFEMDKNDHDRDTRQRWVSRAPQSVTIDFLMPPTDEKTKGGTLQNLEHDFAAMIAPGLRCGFRGRVSVTLRGETLYGERAERKVQVCNAGAYIVLKALAYEGRGERKDAYDLYYVLRNYKRGPKDVAAEIKPLLDDPEAQVALEVLKRDFTDPEGTGARRVAWFITGAADDNIQADVVGFVGAFLKAVERLLGEGEGE